MPSAKPRQSGIPTTGRSTGIPTPGRTRPASAASQRSFAVPENEEAISAALADALHFNDPALHRPRRSDALGISTHESVADFHASHSGRRSVTGRPSSNMSTTSALGLSQRSRPRTPTARSVSRQSERRSSSRIEVGYRIGENVRIESLGFEGVLRFLGEIDGKSGQWAGVELS